ncbi:type II toxin-antitoxin system HipA family toxin [Pseudomonas sp. C9-3]|uniref:type II toxin-antitoxin system HipA family toxin n=1 Tax=Pseudomonas sp. C9-3 TaxID=3078264 RepID=UPI0028E1E08A|nr:HipA domain-containing protein [Pseudomonas sp. C9-3]
MSNAVRMTVQAQIGDDWFDALTLVFTRPEQGRFGPCAFSYTDPFISRFHSELGTPFACAVSVRHRLDWTRFHTEGFPAFLYDLMPSGAARTVLCRWRALQALELPPSLDGLMYCTPAPVGHLRIKESAALIATAPRFAVPREEVVRQNLRLFDPGEEHGLVAGGSLGAGGEAPKLLLAETRHGELFADALLPDQFAERHWLVKFPRGSTALDRDILRSEYLYYRAVAQLGLDSIALHGLAFESDDFPSLWMPRFDRVRRGEAVHRMPMESMYSLCGNTHPGSALRHEAVLTALVGLWREAGQAHLVEDLVFEYLRRDLLNRILGNSDNHGRNSAILRDDQLTLAPIYDLAPMVLDPHGISRSTKWAAERRHRHVWRAVCEVLAEFAEPGAMFDRLRDTAQRFRALPDLLVDLPHAVRSAPVIPLNNLDVRLREWGLR